MKLKKLSDDVGGFIAPTTTDRSRNKSCYIYYTEMNGAEPANYVKTEKSVGEQNFFRLSQTLATEEEEEVFQPNRASLNEIRKKRKKESFFSSLSFSGAESIEKERIVVSRPNFVRLYVVRLTGDI